MIKLNSLLPTMVWLRDHWPAMFHFLVRIGRVLFGRRLGVYPQVLAGEIAAVERVLKSSAWNMTYGRGLAHDELETAFAQYVGVPYAVAVGSGGMALQMSLRAAGLRLGHEVVHQIDTCSATAMAVMNAGCTPLFGDISPQTLMLSLDDVRGLIGPSTKALIATHMWGNIEDIAGIQRLSEESGLFVIEDACLALGATYDGRMTGSFGDVGIFSFGCLKPIQGGEGGMILTRDEALARELRAMRHWGDRTLEFGVRDTTQLSWNGRMSEIVAAVVREQLRGYPAHLRRLREAVAEFRHRTSRIEGLEVVYGMGTENDASFTQVVVRIEKGTFGCSKRALMAELSRLGIRCWHANFELINSLTFFRAGTWAQWTPQGDLERIRANYSRTYPTAQRMFDSDALGISQSNFLSKGNLDYLTQAVTQLALRGSG